MLRSSTALATTDKSVVSMSDPVCDRCHMPARRPHVMTPVLLGDIYRPNEWPHFFLVVGGGSAALTGLVFVVMLINLYVIFRDPTHRSRAVGTLTGFVAAFLICARRSWADRTTSLSAVNGSLCPPSPDTSTCTDS